MFEDFLAQNTEMLELLKIKMENNFLLFTIANVTLLQCLLFPASIDRVAKFVT
jgi:hypothetical protein